MADDAVTEFWEARYSERARIWSGKANKVLVDVASDWPPGAAVDLGCGEGADAIWLAQRGWHVDALDVSTTAIARAAEAAQDLGISDTQIDFQATDLSKWLPTEGYDLVTAFFFHSRVELARDLILLTARDALNPGGRLLIVSHADFPPWSGEHRHEEHNFLSPQEQVAELKLAQEDFDVELAETRTRQAVGPDGEQATLDDAVVLVRRRQA